MNLDKSLVFLILFFLGGILAIVINAYHPSISRLVEYLGIASAVSGVVSLIYAFIQQQQSAKQKEAEKKDAAIQELERKIESISKELERRNLAQDEEISSVHRDTSLLMQNYNSTTSQLFGLTEKLSSFHIELSDIKASQAYHSRISELIKRIEGLENILLAQKSEELKSIIELSKSYQSILREIKEIKGDEENVLKR